jgi:crotonobetainyl-CoA:carnitine CoA-transferase CaiB-like acyl-CoA transferase
VIGPLDSIHVVDLTDLRGALCGRVLGDLGADVVKIDLPGADLSSTAYRYRNANKRRASVDLATDTGRGRLEEFLSGADVVIENFDREWRASCGLAPDDLGPRFPRLIHVALADFGLSGPRASWRLEPLPGLAASGALHASGFPDRPPCWLPGHLAHDCASAYGAIGAVAALMDRDRQGVGQLVEVSVQEAAIAGTTPWSIALEDYLKINPFLPSKGTRNADGSYWVLPAADGWIRTVIGNGKQWRGFLSLVRDPEVLQAPEWKDQIYRLQNGDVIRLVAGEVLPDRTRAELFAEAQATGATVGVLHTPSEYVDHPQTRARSVFLNTGFKGLDGAPFVSPPLRLSATPSALRRSAPEPGDDSDPWPTPDEAATAECAADGRLLLEGVRVVEFGMAAVVPEACLVLSELGADVVKIESETHLDVLRASGYGRVNCGFAFNAECRGRRSIVLNLEAEEGRRLAFELCRRADVVAENFRGGVLDSLGLGYEAVKQANPGVVYVSSQGYGREGPLADTPAYGPLNLGFTGLHHLWNHPDAPYPCGTSLNHPDHIAGKFLAVGVLAALRHRAHTGQGQLVDMAQTELAAFLLGEIYLDAHLSGRDPQPQGNESDRAVPHNVYPTVGEDRWLAVAVPSEEAWDRLRLALGWAEDDELASLAGRLARRGEIDARMAEWTRSRTAEEAAALLQQGGVSAMPVMGPEDHHADPHLTSRGFIVHLEHPEVGAERHAGNPLHLSRLDQRTAQSAPCLGADTEAILTDEFGLGAADVAALRESGVCR